MKLAISSKGKTLESEVDPRFGRCKYFILCDEDLDQYEVLNNGGQSAVGGAGVQAAESVVNSGAKTVLTGNVGPKAFQVMSSSGILVVTDVCGTVKEVIEQYLAGDLTVTREPSVDAHFGLR